jgi:hypothetical protein
MNGNVKSASVKSEKEYSKGRNKGNKIVKERKRYAPPQARNKEGEKTK